MSPVEIIVTALASGAAAALKPVVEDTIRESYQILKTLIKERYDTMGVDLIERDPSSKAFQHTTQEILSKTKAPQDKEVLYQSKAVLGAVEKASPDTSKVIGVELEDIKAGAALNIEDIISNGSGVSAKRVETQGDITIKGIHAGQGASAHDPKSTGQ